MTNKCRRQTLLALVGAIALLGGIAIAAVPRVQAATPVAQCGTPSATGGTPAPIPTVAAIPTQAAVGQEVNPPGDIPDNQAFVSYTSGIGGYSISMPEGWERTEDGANVRFADKLHTFSVDITCWSGPLSIDTVTSTEIPLLSQHVAAFELVEVTAVSLPAGDALLVRYHANSDPDSVTGKQHRLDVDRYLLVSNGRMAAISLAVPSGSDNVDVSNLVSQSFRWTS